MRMAEYLNKEMFLQSMGLIGDETKYGNRDREHQNRSYSTWMGYEIIGSIEDSVVEEDVVEVVRCKDCKHWQVCVDGFTTWCPLLMDKNTKADDFCSYGERREGE
jgi:hypothetical protein